MSSFLNPYFRRENFAEAKEIFTTFSHLSLSFAQKQCSLAWRFSMLFNPLSKSLNCIRQLLFHWHLLTFILILHLQLKMCIIILRMLWYVKYVFLRLKNELSFIHYAVCQMCQVSIIMEMEHEWNYYTIFRFFSDWWSSGWCAT